MTANEQALFLLAQAPMPHQTLEQILKAYALSTNSPWCALLSPATRGRQKLLASAVHPLLGTRKPRGSKTASHLPATQAGPHPDPYLPCPQFAGLDCRITGRHPGSAGYTEMAICDGGGQVIARLLGLAGPAPVARPPAALLALMYDKIRQELARRLQQEDIRLFRQIILNSDDIISYVDNQLVYRLVSRGCQKAFDMDGEQLLGKAVADLHDPVLFNAQLRPILNRCLRGDVVHTQHWLRLKGRRPLYLDVTYSPYSSTLDGQPAGVIINAHDITHLKHTEEELYYLSTHDSLTNCHNRRFFMSQLDHVIASLNRSKSRHLLIFIDLDNFKQINDTHGHGAGDAVLIETVKRLKLCIREGDTLARIGGDEFVMLFEPAGPDDGFSPAKIRAMLAKINQCAGTPVLTEGGNIEFSFSVGFYLIDENAKNSQAALSMADRVMYQTKVSRQQPSSPGLLSHKAT